MMQFKDIPAFLEYLEAMPARLIEADKQGLTDASKIVLKEMQQEIGTYQGGDAGFDDWSPLAARTVQNKGGPPDRPLEDTGQMRESLGYQVGDGEAVIGTDDMVAVYQEEGTSFNPHGAPVPARSFIARSAFRKEPEAVEAMIRPALTVLGGGIAPNGPVVR